MHVRLKIAALASIVYALLLLPASALAAQVCTSQPVGTRDLPGILGNSDTDIIGVGKQGVIFRYDGSTWNAMYNLGNGGETLQLVAGNWAAPDTACSGGKDFEDLWGDSTGNIYLAARNEVYLHNGSNYSVEVSTAGDLYGAYGAGNQVFAAGKTGVVLHFDGNTWQESTDATNDINDVWVSAAGNAYFSGTNAEITVYTGVAPKVVADWHLDECTLGISGSVVADSSGNGLDGVSVGGLDIEINGQLCSAAAFDGTSAYVSVPDAPQLDLTAGISIAVWVRHNNSSLKNWEAILAKDDSTYRLHLNGGCSIADTLPGNTSHGITFGLNGGCGGADLNSNVVPVPGVWYHVAATYDRSVMRLYIDGILVNSAKYSAQINTNSFDLFIGENSQRRNRYWNGDIDELTIWSDAISATEVVNHMQRTRPCTNCSNFSFRINHDNFGIHCLAEAIQVDIIDGLTGSPRTDYNQQLTLDTQTGTGSWTLTTGSGTFSDTVTNDGIATYDWPLGESTAVFLLDYKQGTPVFDIDVFQTSDPIMRDNDTEGMITFSASGFTVSETPLRNPPPGIIPPFASPRIAGTDFAVYLTAFGQTPTDPTCGVIETYTGPQNIKFWFNRFDPASGSIAVTVDAAAVSVTEVTATAQAVVFTNGQAMVTAKYKDAGRISILLKDDSRIHADLPDGIRGATASIPVKPQRFVLMSIKDAGGMPNPAAIDASGPVFLAAGAPFSVTVTALDAEGSVTPNFGRESIAETVRLTSSLVSPAAANDPGVNPLFGFGAFSGGTATGSNFAWPEVGIITLTPSIGDADYLGGGDVTGTISGNVGRFVPDHFASSVNTPLFGTQCGSGGFTYVGQSFAYSTAPLISFTAVAVSGSTTQNYQGRYFKVTNTTLQNRSYTSAAGLLNLSGLPPSATDPVIADTGAGSGTLLFSSGSGISFLRSSIEPPFNADITLNIDLLDGDGVAALTSPVTVASIGFDNGSDMRYGRIRFVNALGSELVNLAVPLRAEYFASAASGFVTHIDDSCTVDVSLSLGNFTANLGTGETCVLDSGGPGSSGAGCAAAGPAGQRYREPPLGGDFNLFLLAPGTGNDGSMTVTGDVPAWLEFDWNVALPGLEDPNAAVTFGIYNGDDKRIYTRELY